MSSFTSVLKNIGLAAAEAGLTYVGLGAIAQRIKPKSPVPVELTGRLQDIWDLVQRNQLIIATLKDVTLTSEQKRAMIVPEVVAIVLDIDDFRGHQPEDPQLFAANVNMLIDAVVGIGNSFKKRD